MKRYLFCVVFVFILGCQPSTPRVETGVDDTFKIAAAYQQRQSDLWVEAEGVVIKLLPDDLQGSRHQRFILRLSNGQTLLMSYNIDIAKRMNTLREGAFIQFRGEYEWNEKGGVVHWLHHDPNGRKSGGWVKYNNQIYR